MGMQSAVLTPQQLIRSARLNHRLPFSTQAIVKYNLVIYTTAVSTFIIYETVNSKREIALPHSSLLTSVIAEYKEDYVL
jgi:hypothetical protein